MKENAKDILLWMYQYVFCQLLGFKKKEVVVHSVTVVNLVFIIMKNICSAFLEEWYRNEPVPLFHSFLTNHCDIGNMTIIACVPWHLIIGIFFFNSICHGDKLTSSKGV